MVTLNPLKFYMPCRCNIGGELLYRMIGQIENAIVLCNKLMYQLDPMKRNLEKVLQELRDDYLPSFLRRFVCECKIVKWIIRFYFGSFDVEYIKICDMYFTNVHCISNQHLILATRQYSMKLISKTMHWYMLRFRCNTIK